MKTLRLTQEDLAEPHFLTKKVFNCQISSLSLDKLNLASGNRDDQRHRDPHFDLDLRSVKSLSLIHI